MKIPNKLKIGGFIWKVKKDADIAYEGNCYGSTHHRSQKIFLDPANTPQKMEQSFLHEVLHVIWDYSGLIKRPYPKEQEEEVIDTLSKGLYQVLKDNKLLK